MNDSFSPQTVAVVALASLVAGFVAVFGGGMIAMRPSGQPPGESAHEPPVAPTPARREPDAGAVAASADADAGPASPEPVDDARNGGAAAPAGNVEVAPLGISRCWGQDAGTSSTPGASCGSLADLDRHFASKRAELAACTRAHGRMPFVIDLRFSTGSVRSWGGPSSTIANAGDVAACVRRATQPMPLAQMAHAFDRYIVTVPLTW
ncbi:MAG: hypothetical protein R3A52_25405 [Polyangiales bacterium]